MGVCSRKNEQNRPQPYAKIVWVGIVAPYHDLILIDRRLDGNTPLSGKVKENKRKKLILEFWVWALHPR